MPRSPVTALLEGYNALTEVEQKVFLDLVDPQPEPEAPAKQTRKKRGPSKKAQSLSTAITSSREAKAEVPASGQKCVAQVPGLNVECGNPEDNGIHDPNGGYGGYHEFEAPKSVASVAKRSSRKSGAVSSTQNTEIAAGAAFNAAHAGG